ncbi:MAG: hypothetical protein IIZ39_11860 [Blautia sp.]|nr:hypothetical protein [Blautia sp.]
MLAEDIRRVLAKREGFSEEQDEEIKGCWEKEVKLLCKNEKDTARFLAKECTEGEFVLLCEVLEEVAGRLMSKAVFEAIEKAGKRFSKVVEEEGLEEVLAYALSYQEDIGDAW